MSDFSTVYNGYLNTDHKGVTWWAYEVPSTYHSDNDVKYMSMEDFQEWLQQAYDSLDELAESVDGYIE